MTNYAFPMGVCPILGLEFGSLTALMLNLIALPSRVGLWSEVQFFLITQYLSLLIRPCEYHIHTKTGKGHFSSDRIVFASSCPLQAM